MATVESYPVEVPITVHWGDMDALGHVNNARYFTWFESARMALFEHVGLVATGTPEVGPILAHTRCDFLKPVVYGDDIVAGTRIGHLGNSSFVMEYGLLWGEPRRRELVARGEGVIVLIDYRNGNKVSIPEDLRGKLEALR